MHNIVIIGTLPPCPRCHLLTEIVCRKAKAMGLDAAIRHISYASEEAADIAEANGLTAGTGKDVARLMGAPLDLNALMDMSGIDGQPGPDAIEDCLKPLEQLMKEVAILDRRLRPLEERALEFGIMMTPVLVIDGGIRYQGSVPKLDAIDGWLSALKQC